MSRLIESPTVFVVAKTMMDEFQLQDWDRFNDPTNGQHEDTPLGLLLDESEDAGAHRVVEFAGRHCYRSWNKGRDRDEYIQNIIAQNHGSVLEHANLTFAIQGVSRTLTHELVRHRVGVAISQESQRYVDAKDVNFVLPPLVLHISKGVTDPAHPLIVEFEEQCLRDLRDYIAFQDDLRMALKNTNRSRATIVQKRINEAARSRLPNAAETRLTWTANMRLLRHFLEMRGSEHADLEIRRLACHIHDACTEHAPEFFRDFAQVEGEFGVNNVVRTVT